MPKTQQPLHPPTEARDYPTTVSPSATAAELSGEISRIEALISGTGIVLPEDAGRLQILRRELFQRRAAEATAAN